MTKAGFSGDDAPRAVFPSIIGEVFEETDFGYGRYHTRSVGDTFVGDEAQAKRKFLRLRNFMERGVVSDYRNIERVLHHCWYNELAVTPEEHPVMVTEPPLRPKRERETLTKIMFETFNVVAYFAANTEVLPMYASGRLTGVTLGSGDGVSHVVPIYEGHALQPQISRIPLGGTDITQYLVELLGERGVAMTTPAEREIVRDIKEKLLFVSQDFDAELQSSREIVASIAHDYELPDGAIMSVGTERIQAPEMLFRPSLIGSDHPGIHLSVLNCIAGTIPELWRVFYGNIVLAGGNTLFPGFHERLKSEIQSRAPRGASIGVAAPAERKFSVWIGGSIQSSRIGQDQL